MIFKNLFILFSSRALDFFLTAESLENDSSELTWILTWTRVSPVKALSLLCPRNLPSHPLTAQFAVRVLRSVHVHLSKLFISIFILNLSKFYPFEIWMKFGCKVESIKNLCTFKVLPCLNKFNHQIYLSDLLVLFWVRNSISNLEIEFLT